MVSFLGDLFPSNTDSTDVAAFGKPICTLIERKQNGIF